MATRKKQVQRKINEAHISRAVRIREQRGQFETWNPDLARLHDYQKDLERLSQKGKRP